MTAALPRLVSLARPKGALLIASLPVVGYGYGLWERGSTIRPADAAPTLVLLASAWLCGHAGAMWLNAVLDRDEGLVLLGRAVPVPRAASAAGYGALGASLSLAAVLGVVPLACAAVCAVLAVLYSHPRVALKGHPAGGPLVNALGYGVASPVAGWAAADPVPTWRAGITLALAVVGILGAYFAAQAFQRDEDRRRGYRTLVALWGPGRTLVVARACLGLVGLAVVAAAAAGVYPRTMLVTAPLLLWIDRHLERWTRQPHGGDDQWAAGLVVRVVLAILLTVTAAYAHHLDRLGRDLPGGGLGTAVVPAALEQVELTPGR